MTGLRNLGSRANNDAIGSSAATHLSRAAWKGGGVIPNQDLVIRRFSHIQLVARQIQDNSDRLCQHGLASFNNGGRRIANNYTGVIPRVYGRLVDVCFIKTVGGRIIE